MQAFEAGFEANRRRDDRFAAEQWAAVREHVATKNGIILIAEQDRRAVGWAVAHEDLGEVFITERERHRGYIAELFVEEAVRGQGYGRALMAACEDWARERGLAILMIGVLTKNTRAARAYESSGYAPYGLTLRKYL